MDPTRMMTDTVTVRAQSGVSTAGDPTYGAAIELVARVERGRTRAFEGIEHSVVVYTTTEIPVRSLVWLPGDDASDYTEARRARSSQGASAPGSSLTLWATAL